MHENCLKNKDSLEFFYNIMLIMEQELKQQFNILKERVQKAQDSL